MAPTREQWDRKGEGKWEIPNEPCRPYDFRVIETTFAFSLGSREWTSERAVCDVPVWCFETTRRGSSWVRESRGDLIEEDEVGDFMTRIPAFLSQRSQSYVDETEQTARRKEEDRRRFCAAIGERTESAKRSSGFGMPTSFFETSPFDERERDPFRSTPTISTSTPKPHSNTPAPITGISVNQSNIKYDQWTSLHPIRHPLTFSVPMQQQQPAIPRNPYRQGTATSPINR
jgi:hypothetical protein